MTEVVAPDGTRLHVESSRARGSRSPCSPTGSRTPAWSSPRSRRCSPGTKVRFCFRGHAHSGTPEPGHYRFADFAGDLDAVATRTARRARSARRSAQGAITHLLGSDPTGSNGWSSSCRPRSTCALTEHAGSTASPSCSRRCRTTRRSRRSSPTPARRRLRARSPGSASSTCSCGRTSNAIGVARAIREITRDVAIEDRELLRTVEAPTLILCQEGDELHPRRARRRSSPT